MTDKLLIISAILFFFAGFGMYYVIAELMGIYSLPLVLFLGCIMGWTTGKLILIGEER